MVVGILPVIGIPLPFISYGGSSSACEYVYAWYSSKLISNKKKLYLISKMKAIQKLNSANNSGKYICVGLDTDPKETTSSFIII